MPWNNSSGTPWYVRARLMGPRYRRIGWAPRVPRPRGELACVASDEAAQGGGDGHRERTPERDARGARRHGCARRACGHGAEDRQERERRGRHERDEDRRRAEGGDRERKARADGEARRRGARGLQRTRFRSRGDTQLIARVRAQGVVRHQLLRDLARQRGLEAAAPVDGRELTMLAFAVGLELAALAIEVGLLAVGLGVDRHVLAGRHRHRARYQARDTRDHDVAVRDIRRRDSEDEARGGNNAVVRAKNGSAQPTDPLAAVRLPGARFQRRSSILIGSARTRTPVAWWTAFAMAAAVPASPISPMPRAPSSFRCRSGNSTKCTSRAGTSAFAATM